MLNNLYVDCHSPSPVILAQFTTEMCVTARNGNKLSTKPYSEGPRWFKVVDFDVNRKCVLYSFKSFWLVINSNFGLISHRYWNTATYSLKIAKFSYPFLIKRALIGVTLLEFLGSLRILKLKTLWQRQWKFRDPNLHRFDTIAEWQTGRHTDKQTPLR